MDILNSQVTYGDSQVTPVLMGGSCVGQWYSTWGTRVICDTLTKKL